MSIGAILGAIAALGTIAGLVKWGGAWLIRTFRKTPAQTGQSIDEKIADEKNQVKDGGRPKWD